MSEFDDVFAALRAILQPYEAHMTVQADDDGQLYLDTVHVQGNGKPLFFAAVARKKAYVSFHLMPIYVNPELLTGISDALRARMQGKSCFNFKRVDPVLFAELEQLTRAGYDNYRTRGYV